MKMVSAAKVRKAQEKMEQARPYTSALEDVIHHILPDIDRADLDLLAMRYNSPEPELIYGSTEDYAEIRQFLTNNDLSVDVN